MFRRETITTFAAFEFSTHFPTHLLIDVSKSFYMLKKVSRKLKSKMIYAWISAKMLKITGKIKGKLKKNIPSSKDICLLEISTIFSKYRTEFMDNKIKKNDITKYEAAAGFTLATRLGSRPFCQLFGRFMEDVYNVSKLFTRCSIGGCDGRNDDSYFECKSKYNTMKQGQALSEIQGKMAIAIRENRRFYLLILTDENDKSRNIPLHKGKGLTGLQFLPGYDPEMHRWISGTEIYNLLFPHYAQEVENHIIQLLRSLQKLGN